MSYQKHHFHPISILVFFLLSIFTQYGCVHTIGETFFSSSEIIVQHDKLIIDMKGTAPLGKYLIETNNNQIAGSCNVTVVNYRRDTMIKHSIIKLHKAPNLSSEIAASCMHIIMPNGEKMAIGPRHSTEFYIPAWELNALKHELGIIHEKIINLERQINNKQIAEKWLKRHSIQCHETSIENKCEEETYALYGNYCFTNNLACQTVSGASRFLNADEMLSTATGLSCSLITDNFKPDLYAYLRSYFISSATHKIMKSLNSGEYGKNEKLTADVIAGLVNSYLCIKDKMKPCITTYNNRRRTLIKRQKRCIAMKKQYENAISSLGENNMNLYTAKKEAEKMNKKIKSLEKTSSLPNPFRDLLYIGRRIIDSRNYWNTVRGCK